MSGKEAAWIWKQAPVHPNAVLHPITKHITEYLIPKAEAEPQLTSPSLLSIAKRM